MFIAPILLNGRTGTNLKQIWLFLERNGTHLIQIDATDEATAIHAANEFVAFNDMTAIGVPVVVGDIVFVNIDPASKDIHSFYTWKEVPAGTIPSKEAWRSFLWVSTKDNVDPLGVNRLLDSIPLAEKTHSAFSVVTSYLKTCY